MTPGEEAAEEPAAGLCLVPCPWCKSENYRGGVCRLDRGHTGEHECNAVGGDVHLWR
jgi:hypothetical protein